jgi:RNA polymerase sigma-70 factor (ECF subfamily)
MDHQDAFWVERARRGDRVAFGWLVEKYTPSLRRLIIHKLGRADDVQDLLQETWFHVFVSLERLREPPKFASWLYGLTLNRIRLWLRHTQSQPTSWDALLDETPDLAWRIADRKTHSAEEEVIARETREVVERALGQLSNINREVVALYYGDGLSYRVIAERLKVPTQTVKSRLHKARQQLRMLLHSHLDLPVLTASQTRKGVLPMISAHIYEVYACELVAGIEPPYGESPVSVVVLKAQDHERYLPLFMRASDAHAIARPLRSLHPCQPLTHDLMAQIIERLGHRVESVAICAVHGARYDATLRVATDRGGEEFACRPSDGLALAIRLNVPIVVAPELLERWGSTQWDTAILQNAVPGGVAAITPMALTKV